MFLPHSLPQNLSKIIEHYIICTNEHKIKNGETRSYSFSSCDHECIFSTHANTKQNCSLVNLSSIIFYYPKTQDESNVPMSFKVEGTPTAEIIQVIREKCKLFENDDLDYPVFLKNQIQPVHVCVFKGKDLIFCDEQGGCVHCKDFHFVRNIISRKNFDGATRMRNILHADKTNVSQKSLKFSDQEDFKKYFLKRQDATQNQKPSKKRSKTTHVKSTAEKNENEKPRFFQGTEARFEDILVPLSHGEICFDNFAGIPNYKVTMKWYALHDVLFCTKQTSSYNIHVCEETHCRTINNSHSTVCSLSGRMAVADARLAGSKESISVRRKRANDMDSHYANIALVNGNGLVNPKQAAKALDKKSGSITYIEGKSASRFFATTHSRKSSSSSNALVPYSNDYNHTTAASSFSVVPLAFKAAKNSRQVESLYLDISRKMATCDKKGRKRLREEQQKRIEVHAKTDVQARKILNTRNWTELSNYNFTCFAKINSLINMGTRCKAAFLRWLTETQNNATNHLTSMKSNTTTTSSRNGITKKFFVMENIQIQKEQKLIRKRHGDNIEIIRVEDGNLEKMLDEKVNALCAACVRYWVFLRTKTKSGFETPTLISFENFPIAFLFLLQEGYKLKLSKTTTGTDAANVTVIQKMHFLERCLLPLDDYSSHVVGTPKDVIMTSKNNIRQILKEEIADRQKDYTLYDPFSDFVSSIDPNLYYESKPYLFSSIKKKKPKRF